MNPTKRIIKRRLIIIASIIAFIVLYSAAEKIFIRDNRNISGIEIHYIDVGQGDSSLILCGKSAMLIDGGSADHADYICGYLKKQGVKKLDMLICTHADDDHAGGLCGAFRSSEVSKVYAPETKAKSSSYKSFERAVSENKLSAYKPGVGEKYTLGEISGEFLGPVYEDYDDTNNTSIVVKITYKERSFLFMGDAEYEEEYDILNTGEDIKADVIKVGHHGADTSSSDELIEKVKPIYGIISVGVDNDYGHPSDKVLKRFESFGTEILRTDLSGTIILECDGFHINFKTAR